MKKLTVFALVLAIAVSTTACQSKAGTASNSYEGATAEDFLTKEEIQSNTNLEEDALSIIFNYVYAKYQEPTSEEKAALDQLLRYTNGEILRAMDPEMESPRIMYSPVGPNGEDQEYFVFPVMNLYKMYGPEILAMVLLEESAHAADYHTGLIQKEGTTQAEAIEEEVRAARVTTQFWGKYLEMVDSGELPKVEVFASEQDAAEYAGYTELVKLWKSNKVEWEKVVREAATQSYNPDGTPAPLLTP